MVLITIVLQACSTNAEAANNTPAPTRTPTLDPTPIIIPTPCPQSTLVTAPKLPNPKLIYVLIDISGSVFKSEFYSLPDIRNLLGDALAKSLNPGDELIIAFIGEKEDKENYPLQKKVPMVQLNLVNPPSKSVSESLLATPTPYNVEDYLSQITTTQTICEDAVTLPLLEQRLPCEKFSDAKVAATVAATRATATIATIATLQAGIQQSNENEYGCAVWKNNSENFTKLHKWERDQHFAIEQFLDTSVYPVLENIPVEQGYTHIYYSLFIASETIQTEQEINHFSSIKVLIFSDMQDASGDHKNDNHNDLEINLQGVDVYVAMMACHIQKETVYEQNYTYCQDQETKWRDILMSYGVNQPVKFSIPQSTNTDTIATFINQH